MSAARDLSTYSGVTFLTVDGRLYVEGPWPALIGISSELMEQGDDGPMAVDPDLASVRIGAVNGAALYREAGRIDGVWVGELVFGDADPVPSETAA